MSADLNDGLRAELLDDFYAECDELLTSIREALTKLEEPTVSASSREQLLSALARHLHTVKGNAAIVGLRPVEELAHAMEDFLKAGISADRRLATESVDLLLMATQRLEQTVVSHRAGQVLPVLADLLTKLRAISASSPVPAASASSLSRELSPYHLMARLRTQGLTPALAKFTPTPALNQRDVNVGTIRNRILALGEVVSAVPKVLGPGNIQFTFLIGLREAVANPSEWLSDGVTWEDVSESVGAETPDPTGQSADVSLTPSHIVRVELAKLDELMRIMGEMVIHRLRLDERLAQQSGDTSALREVAHANARSLRELRETIGRIRMVPIAEIFHRMPYVVRDLARDSNKQVRVVLEGAQTEVDKFVAERLKEPLLHLVRNAFVHGIEPASERSASGKPAEATVQLRARTEGDSAIIEIRDDGRGVGITAVAERAESLGLTIPEPLTADGLLKVLCLPGFSTQEKADRAAGRGVGMAVVETTIREMGGSLTLTTAVGKGSVFTLCLPLSLSVGAALIVEIADQICAIHQGVVNEVIQISAGDARSIQQTSVVPYRDMLLPLFPLRSLFRLPAISPDLLTVLVVQTARGVVGLLVDRVRGQQEIVIRPLADSLLRVPGISGTTELGDGRPILILDPAIITQGVIRPLELVSA